MNVTQWALIIFAALIIIIIAVISIALWYQAHNTVQVAQTSNNTGRNINRPAFQPPSTQPLDPNVPVINGSGNNACRPCRPIRPTRPIICSTCNWVKCKCSQKTQIINTNKTINVRLDDGKCMPRIWRINRNTNRAEVMCKGWVKCELDINALAYDRVNGILYTHVRSGAEKGIYSLDTRNPDGEWILLLSSEEMRKAGYNIDQLPYNEIINMKFVQGHLYLITQDQVYRFTNPGLDKVRSFDGKILDIFHDCSTHNSHDANNHKILVLDRENCLRINEEEAINVNIESVNKNCTFACGGFVFDNAIYYPSEHQGKSGFSMYNNGYFTHDSYDLIHVSSDNEGTIFLLTSEGTIHLLKINPEDLSISHSQTVSDVIPIKDKPNAIIDTSFDHNYIYLLVSPRS